MKKLRNKALPQLLLGLAAMLILFNYMDDAGIKKYALALFFCLIFLFLGRKQKWNLSDLVCTAAPVTAYIFLGGISSLIGALPQMSAVKVILYCTVPLLLATSIYMYYSERIKYIIDMQFFSSAALYLLTNFEEVFWPIIRAYRTNLTVLIREFRWESSYAFAYGIFAVYYAYKKRWGLFFLALIMTYIGKKRIVILAVAVALAVMAFVWLFKKSKKLIYVLWGTVIAAVYGYLVYIYSGGMAYWSEILRLNSNGRLKIYARIIEQYEFSPLYPGKGLGVIEDLLEHWNITTFANLHNDLLKFYIELGFLGLLIYLLSYYVMFYFAEKRGGKNAMLYLMGILSYTLVLFATDNVSIFLIYLLPFYTTIYAVLTSENKPDDDRRKLDDKEDN